MAPLLGLALYSGSGTQKCPFPLNSAVSPSSLKLEAGADLTLGILGKTSSPVPLKCSALVCVCVPQVGTGSPDGQGTRIH